MMALDALLFLDLLQNSINTETTSPSIYGQPKSFSLSGERGIDRFGHQDNSGMEQVFSETRMCEGCMGSGITDEHTCPECEGTGLLKNDQHEVEAAYETQKISGDGQSVEPERQINDYKWEPKDYSSPNIKYGSEPNVLNRVATSKDLQYNPSPKDGPQVGKFDYPTDKPPAKALDFPRSHDKILQNSTRADWCGIERLNSEVPEVPEQYKASTLFIDMAPNRPTLERGKEKYGTSVEQNALMDMVREYQNDSSIDKHDTIQNPGKVDEALWAKAKHASEDAFGKIKWPFVSYIYQKWGGSFQ